MSSAHSVDTRRRLNCGAAGPVLGREGAARDKRNKKPEIYTHLEDAMIFMFS